MRTGTLAHQIARSLRADIEAGLYGGSGARLPPVTELAARHYTSTNVIYRALRLLCNQRVIVVRSRVGHFLPGDPPPIEPRILQRITKRYLHDMIADDLRSRITSGVLGNGTPLPLRQLAAQYQVSTHPVRRALQILAHEGLVTIHPNNGAVVTTP